MSAIELPFSDPTVKQIIQAAFGSGAKSRRKVKIRAKVSHRVWDFWDGGSRDYTAFVRLSDMSAVSSAALPQAARQETANPFGLAISKEDIPLTPGYAVVLHSIFCGKDVGYTIILHPGNLLSANKSEDVALMGPNEIRMALLDKIEELK